MSTKSYNTLNHYLYLNRMSINRAPRDLDASYLSSGTPLNTGVSAPTSYAFYLGADPGLSDCQD